MLKIRMEKGEKEDEEMDGRRNDERWREGWRLEGGQMLEVHAALAVMVVEKMKNNEEQT